ncbi:MAG: phosphoribosylanthranilate isomerase [Candidatus Omnitrophica bacterium]|nr:phosphoribosylanthranilate isomerase [Candidatus Omnitrophota bacterium]
MTRIKICGITNKIDALAAADLGVDMLGFVFYKGSKRHVEPKMARDIINELPVSVKRVGVFVDEKREKVLEIAQDAYLDMLQFHGDETPEYCGSFYTQEKRYKIIKAFRIKDKESLKHVNDYDVDYYLLDTYNGDSIGGSGEVFDWKVLRDFEFLKPVILAGGLTPLNISKAIDEILPYGVDVSTGVERSPGKKDPELMKKFVEKVRKVG